jgi:3'-5' exoribonuclease
MNSTSENNGQSGKPHLRVGEITDRAKVRGIFLVSRKVAAVDKNGKSYLNLLLSDRTGQIDARVFENAEKLGAGFSEHDYVRVSGQAKSFQGRLQLHLQMVERVEDQGLPAEEYLPASARDPEQMWQELLGILESITDPHLSRLLRALFLDSEIAARFRRVPAAKTIHHAWVGGLLEHNLSVYRIIEALCAHYARESPGLLDRDLCVAGGLLHDFGKIYELSAERSFGYTHEGRLIGHLVLCSEKIAEVAGRLEGFPRGRLLQLQHIVLSHHDRLEYGSPRRPHTAEAMLVHAADMLDSRMGFLRQLFQREPGAGWTSYQKVFDRPFYHEGRAGLGLTPADGDGQAAPGPEGEPEAPWEVD